MPTQPTGRQITARLPQDVFDRLQQLADQEQRTLSNLLRFIAIRYLEERDRNLGGSEAASPADRFQ